MGGEQTSTYGSCDRKAGIGLQELLEEQCELHKQGGRGCSFEYDQGHDGRATRVSADERGLLVAPGNGTGEHESLSEAKLT